MSIAKATTVVPVLSLDGGAVDGGYFYELILFSDDYLSYFITNNEDLHFTVI